MLQLPCADVRSLRSPLRAKDILSSPSFPHQGALALFACGSSGFIASMLTRHTNSLRSSAGFPCNRLRQHSVPVGTSEQESLAMLSLYVSAIPHSLRSYAICSVSDSAHRYRFATHSFNGWRCCPIPPLYKVLLGRAFSLRSPLRAGDTLSSPSFPLSGALALFALWLC